MSILTERSVGPGCGAVRSPSAENLLLLKKLTRNSCNNQLVKCCIYKGSRKTDTYLFVKHDAGVRRAPKSLLALLGTLEVVMTIELSEDTTLAQASAKEVIKHLTESGFYLQLPNTDIQ